MSIVTLPEPVFVSVSVHLYSEVQLNCMQPAKCSFPGEDHLTFAWKNLHRDNRRKHDTVLGMFHVQLSISHCH